MKAFSYVRASSPVDAVEQLAGIGGGARVLAGGMDQLDLMKERLDSPDVVVSLADLSSLGGIERNLDGTVNVGARVTLAELAIDELMESDYPALAHAAGKAATPQIRNRATVGGNILQRPRCWYFRKAECACLKKGGTDCPAVAGENQYLAILGGGPCHAVHASSLASALVALDATANILGEDGLRQEKVSDLFITPSEDPTRENSLSETDLLMSYTLPAKGNSQSAYYKTRHKEAYDWAMAEASVSLELVGGLVQSCRIVLGGVAPTPWRAEDSENSLKGRSLTAERISQAAALAVAGAVPLSQNAYKVPIAQHVVEQALLEAAGL